MIKIPTLILISLLVNTLSADTQIPEAHFVGYKVCTSCHENEIKYTFGVYPLQQYLIEFPDGHLQALNITWDSRSKEQGGQHWLPQILKKQIKTLSHRV